MNTLYLKSLLTPTTLLIVLGFTFSVSTQTPPLDEATVVETGKFTSSERAYSQEYTKRYPRHESGALRINVNYAKAHGITDGIGMGGVGCCASSRDPAIKSQEFLRILSCQADAVVMGSAKRTGAHMLTDESYIYTAYEFSVKEVFRDNIASPIKAGKTIEVTRPRGFIRLDGISMYAQENADKFLEPSTTYVLFLHYVPGAHGYMVSSVSGDFAIAGDTYERIGTGCMDTELPRTGPTSMLLTTLRQAVSIRCDTKVNKRKEK